MERHRPLDDVGRGRRLLDLLALPRVQLLLHARQHDHPQRDRLRPLFLRSGEPRRPAHEPHVEARPPDDELRLGAERRLELLDALALQGRLPETQEPDRRLHAAEKMAAENPSARCPHLPQRREPLDHHRLSGHGPRIFGHDELLRQPETIFGRPQHQILNPPVHYEAFT